MRLALHYNHNVDIYRTEVDGYKSEQALVTSIACHIQPLTDEYAQGQMGRDGKDFKLFARDEVRVGDRLVDTVSGDRYDVTAANAHSFRGKTHYEAVLRGV